MFSCRNTESVDGNNQATFARAGEFEGSESCRACHEEIFDKWKGSHHKLSMQMANETNVLGDFDSVYFEHNNTLFHFFRKNDEYMINTQGEDGEYNDYVVRYTFGAVPLQQYIVEFEDGFYQCFQVAWDSDSLRWFHLQADLEIQAEEWMHWTGGSMNWNNMCADCHSTFVEKNYVKADRIYRTSFTEINVGCESCHGPGFSHISYYENEEKNKKNAPPSMHMPLSAESVELVDNCARCHSRRSMLTEVFDYSGRFLDHYYPSMLHYPTYERDGQIKEEDYVYGSFMQSKMYHEGISCRDCHDVHSLELRFQGNTLCLTCHESKYNSYEHHFHDENTEASQCVNCHMTGRFYMGNDFRRDHSFRNPRPDQSLLYGTPNACNSCHNDRSEKWAADFIAEKYGPQRPDHFSDRLLAGQDGNTDSLISLISQNHFPEIARATAIQYFAAQIDDQAKLDILVGMLQDSSAMVRREALISLATFRSMDQFVQALLLDSVRAVRIAAVRYFVMQGKNPEVPGFDKAKEEFLVNLNTNADFASANHEMALYYQAFNKAELAIQSYREALRIDNYFNTSRMNLALLEYQLGNLTEAEQLYLKVIEQEPKYSEAWYMLGLLYNESGDIDRSLKFLKGACEREPLIPGAYYNYALQLIRADRTTEADELIDYAIKNEILVEEFTELRNYFSN